LTSKSCNPAIRGALFRTARTAQLLVSAPVQGEALRKIRVRELAKRLSLMSGATVNVAELIALGAAAGLPLNPASSMVDESQLRRLFTQIWGGDVSEKIDQVLTEQLPLVPAGSETTSQQRESSQLVRVLTPRPVSDSAQAAATAARPAPPPPRPLVAPPVRPARSRTVRVDQLAPMTRAVLPDELRGRDRIRQQEAERFAAVGLRWAAAGFTHRAARTWLDRGVAPEAAAYLALRGVTPVLLDRELPAASGPATGAALIADGVLPAEQVHELLVAEGHHVAVMSPEPVLTAPTRAARTPVAIPQVAFSSPGADQPAEFPAVPSRRRRTAKRTQDHRTTERR
jgi:hypothetical protein